MQHTTGISKKSQLFLVVKMFGVVVVHTYSSLPPQRNQTQQQSKQ
jgi:hypothetical protein